MAFVVRRNDNREIGRRSRAVRRINRHDAYLSPAATPEARGRLIVTDQRPKRTCSRYCRNWELYSDPKAGDEMFAWTSAGRNALSAL